MKWNKLRNNSKSVLAKKEGEATSAIRKTVIQNAENVELHPILELNARKESTRDQILAIYNKTMINQLSIEADNQEKQY